MNKKTIAKKLFVLLVVLGLLVFFIPSHSANAADPVTGLLSWSFEVIVSKIAGFFLSLAGNAISWLAWLVDTFIQYQTNNGAYGVFVVDQSWTIVRNFVNMFFILVLIIMAFGTIFGREKYSYRQMLGPFLIAALLVNFSLAIGQYIISFANGLSSIFLKQMGSLSASFAQGTSLGKLVTNDSALKLAGNIVGAGPNIAISAIFSVVLLVIVLIALLAIAIFTVARLFMLWFLLIISPIAWIGYSFPLLKGKTWSAWWEQFLCWCFFLPYYLFFMLFALMFIQNKDNPALKISDSSQTLIGLSVNDFMFYALSIVFMVGGLGIAKKLACASGRGVGKVFGAIEGTVGGYVKRTTGYTGLKKGLQAKSEEVLEKGAFGIPGLQAGRIREAKIAERFSFGALRGEQERQLIKETNDLKGKIKDRSETDLKGMMGRGPITQQLAARELLKEKGLLDVRQLLETYELYRGKNAKGAAARFLGTIDFEDLSGDERRRIDEKLTANQDVTDIETRRKLAKARAEKGDLKNATVEELSKYTTQFGKFTDKLDFLTKVQRQNFENSVKVQTDLRMIKDQAGREITDYNKALEQRLRTMNLDAIMELSPIALRRLLQPVVDPVTGQTGPSDAERIISARLTKGVIENLPGKLDSERLSVLENLAKTKKTDIETEEGARLEKQAEAQARGMKPLVDSIKELIDEIRKRP